MGEEENSNKETGAQENIEGLCENKNEETEVQENIEGICENNYELIKCEIVSAIINGVEEGVKEGVKNGILGGLDECFSTGFPNIGGIGIKNVGDILEEVASETAKNQVKDRIKSKTCPVLERQGDKFCEKILDEIEEESEGVPEAELDIIRALNIEEVCKDKANEIKQEIGAKLPQNFVALALFDGMLEAIAECMVEDVESCSEKIQEAARHSRSV